MDALRLIALLFLLVLVGGAGVITAQPSRSAAQSSEPFIVGPVAAPVASGVRHLAHSSSVAAYQPACSCLSTCFYFMLEQTELTSPSS